MIKLNINPYGNNALIDLVIQFMADNIFKLYDAIDFGNNCIITKDLIYSYPIYPS